MTTLNDSHCHFFSPRFLETLGREKYRAQAGVESDRIATELGWTPPGSPEALADHWIVELDRHHVSRVALIASVPGDEESVALAVRRHPTRFVVEQDLQRELRAPVRALRTRLLATAPALFGEPAVAHLADIDVERPTRPTQRLPHNRCRRNHHSPTQEAQR